MGTVEHSGQCHDRARNGKSASEFPFLSGLRKWLVRLLWCLFFNMHEHDVNNTIILSSKIPIIKYFGYITSDIKFILFAMEASVPITHSIMAWPHGGDRLKCENDSRLVRKLLTGSVETEY